MNDPLPHRSLLDCVDWRSLVRRRLEPLELPRGALAERIGQPAGWTSRVLGGRAAIDPQIVPRLAAALGLDPETERHLADLVDLESVSPRARRRAFAAVAERQRGRASTELQEELFLLRTSAPVRAIAALAACEGFRLDPAWVGGMLVPPVGEDDAQEGLTALIRLGVLGMDEAGEVAPQPDVLVRLLGPEPDGVVLAVGELAHTRVMERIRAFHRELVALAAEQPGPRTQVVRVRVDTSAMSLPTDAEPPAPSERLDDEITGPDLNPDTII